MRSIWPLILLLYSCTSSHQEPLLRVAAASSLQPALIEIIAQLEAETNLKIEPIFSSSGKIAAQATQGAPYDIFLSANDKYPKSLEKNGLTKGEITTFAFGELVILGTQKLPANLNELNDPKWVIVVLPSPEVAPFGQAAKEALFHVGLWDALQPKLAFGENVGMTNNFILTGSADCGFTSRSVIKAEAFSKAIGILPIPEEYYQPIKITAVQLKGREVNAIATQKFMDFLFSAKAQQILSGCGFKPAKAS